jgi:hypothetical protein
MSRPGLTVALRVRFAGVELDLVDWYQGAKRMPPSR